MGGVTGTVMTCPCYDLKPTRIHVYSPRTGKLLGSKHDFVGICYGTKECEECSCGGNREKCDFYPEYRKKSVTNAEKIRSMSDEELAGFLLNANVNFCTAMETDCIYGWHDRDCKKHALDWLHEEVKV